MSAVELHFGEDGKIRSVYSDELPAILDGLGLFTTCRASNVEPEGDGWTADMRPYAGPGAPILGPFRLRGQALAAEREWLDRDLERRSS